MAGTQRRNDCVALALVVAGLLVIPSVVILSSGQQSNVDVGAFTFYTEQFPPYNYQENGTLKGVAVDLIGEMTARMGTRLTPDQVHLVPWTEAYQTVLGSNKSVLLSMARLPEREQSFKWVGPVFTDRYVLFAGYDKGIVVNGAADLNKYRIGVIADDAGVLQLEDAGVNSSHFVYGTNASALVEKLAHGDIDLWCYPEMVGRYIAQEVTANYYSFRVVYSLGALQSYFAFSKDTPNSTIGEFQKALDALKLEKDSAGLSVYDRIVGRYIPSIGLAQLNYLTEEFPPYNFIEGGKPAGLSVEILRAVMDASGANGSAVAVHLVPWAEALEQVRANTSSVVFSIVRTPEREGLYRWAGPFTKSSFVLYAAVSRNITISSAADLNSYDIGVVESTVEGDLLIGQGVDASHIVSASTPSELVGMLASGQIDLWATGDLTGRYEMQKAGLNPNDYESVYVLSQDDFYFAFGKDVPDTMVGAFQHSLDFVRTQKDVHGVSEYERIVYKYLGAGYAMQTFTNGQVMALVNTTAAAIEANASDAFLHINAGQAPYKDPANPGLYAFVYDINVTMVAHADNPSMVGVNYQGKTDVTGKPFRDLIVAGALDNGTGWVEYVYINPAQTNLYYKITYYRLVAGSDGNQYVVCAGNYESR